MRRTAKAAIVLLGVSMLAAACGGDNKESSNTTAPATTSGGGAATSAGGSSTSAGAGKKGGTVTLGYEQEFDTYNTNTSGGNASKNSIVLNPVIPQAFYFDEKGDLVLDKDLMASAELTSKSPETVVWKVQPNAIWEDGTPIGCKDFYLHWYAQNGTLTAADGSTPLFDANNTDGYEDIDKMTCSADGKEITTTFSKPYADWQSLFGATYGLMPAHVVEKNAGGVDVQKAYDTKDMAALDALAKFWNTGFIGEGGQLKPDVMLSGGPYKLAEWVAGQSLTLRRNEKYWGTPGNVDQIVFRYIGATTQPQALQNGEVQIIRPQPNPDLLQQLKAIPDAKVDTYGSFTFEHLDFNFQRPLFQDKAVREAFAYCVPRQDIVDKLIKPLNPDAVVLNNRLYYPFQTDLYKDNSGGKYDKVDIAKAKSTLEAAGWTLQGDVYTKGGKNLEFSIGHIDPNPRRTNTVQLIIASCAQAGMKVTDAPSATYFDDGTGENNTGQFDVSLFAWLGSPLVSGSSSTYVPEGGNNKGKYVNDQIAPLFAKVLSEFDKQAQADAANQIDKILWEDLATIPLFQFADLTANNEKVQNVVSNPTQQEVTWNAMKWSVQ